MTDAAGREGATVSEFRMDWEDKDGLAKAVAFEDGVSIGEAGLMEWPSMSLKAAESLARWILTIRDEVKKRGGDD